MDLHKDGRGCINISFYFQLLLISLVCLTQDAGVSCASPLLLQLDPGTFISLQLSMNPKGSWN